MKKKYIFGAFALTVMLVFGGNAVFAHRETVLIKKIESAAGDTHHLEVKPESLEGYRIPYMKITATLIEQNSKKSAAVELHPMFGGNFHYGANVALEPKQYLIRFHLDPPTFIKGDLRKDQWLSPVEAEFIFDAAAKFDKSVKIGQKNTSDMKISFEAERAEKMFVLANAMQEHTMKEVAPPAATQKNKNTILIVAMLAAGLILGSIIPRLWKTVR